MSSDILKHCPISIEWFVLFWAKSLHKVLSIALSFQKSIEKEPVKLGVCECGTELVREFGTIRCHCQCKSFYCLVSGCVRKHNTITALSGHINNIHFKNADGNQCFHCKGVKDRTATTDRGKCPICQANWCLKGDCPFESENGGAFHSHFRSCKK